MGFIPSNFELYISSLYNNWIGKMAGRHGSKNGETNCYLGRNFLLRKAINWKDTFLLNKN